MTLLEREQMAQKVDDLLMLGFTPSQIQAKMFREGFHPTLSLINYRQAKIRRQMRDRRRIDVNERVDYELGMLEHIRSKSLESFEVSKSGSRIVVNSIDSDGMANSNGTLDDPAEEAARRLNAMIAPRVKTSTKITESDNAAGDPRFLSVANETSSQIRKLLGIDAERIKDIQSETVNNERERSRQEAINMGTEELRSAIEAEIKSFGEVQPRPRVS